MNEITEEERLKSDIYFNEQQQLLTQPQIYYNNNLQTSPPMLMSTIQQNQTQQQQQNGTLNYYLTDNNQQQQQQYSTAKYKPVININETKTSGTNNNINQPVSNNYLINNKLKIKSPYEKAAKDFQSRYKY
jgi:hypothetical protein